jgi:hypothetical protein
MASSSPPSLERLDAVVVGGNVRGLVTAYLLGSLGYRAAVLESGKAPGGVDRSFRAADGTVFDHGLHVLDEMRSPLATRLFVHAVDGAVHRTLLRRAIVLRGRAMPYAPLPSEMPEEIRAMLPSDDLVDDLGDAAPTREALAAYYGRPFVDLIFDEVRPSYPSEHRHKAFGVDESQLLVNIYPWFFPRARRREKAGDRSRAFHDRLRSGIPQHVLYPKEGGFGGFVDGLLRKLDPRRIEVLTGLGDLEIERVPDTHTISSISAGGRRFVADHYFWADAWRKLATVLELPCQDTATDLVVLGSFRLGHPVLTDFHELLVGDPSLRMSRVFFPARFRGSDEPLMQIEYAFPAAEDRPREADWWRAAWLEDAGRLGLVDRRHRVELFDFRSFRMHFNGFGMEGERLRDADPGLLRADSNVRPVVPSMANLNLNDYVPRSVAYVLSVLAGAV